MGIGCMLLGIAFIIMIFASKVVGANEKGSLMWLVSTTWLFTMGELYLSPIGLSLVTKIAPARLVSMMMGMWFLASAYGQYFAGILGANISKASEHTSNLEKLFVYAQGYKQLALYALIAGVLLIAISPLVKKLMQGVK